MAHAGTNCLAVIAAAVATWLWGAAYYRMLGRRWAKAARIGASTSTSRPATFVVSAISALVICFVLAGAIGHLGPGQVTLRNGIISGVILWAGFMATVLAASHRHQDFGWDLTLIDGGHWLGVMIIAGAIIGWFGAVPPPA